MDNGFGLQPCGLWASGCRGIGLRWRFWGRRTGCPYQRRRHIRGPRGRNSPRTLTSGTWRLVDASLIDDACLWMTALGNIWNYDLPYSIDLFLPSQFDVSATMGRFDIKAINYGARDYIACTFIEEAFTCTTQSVDSTPVVTQTVHGNGPVLGYTK